LRLYLRLCRLDLCNLLIQLLLCHLLHLYLWLYPLGLFGLLGPLILLILERLLGRWRQYLRQNPLALEDPYNLWNQLGLLFRQNLFDRLDQWDQWFL
jgi:hypothetical protein